MLLRIFRLKLELYIFIKFRKLYGLIFLYNYSKQYKKNKANKQKRNSRVRSVNANPQYYSSLFYAKQLAQNSCCTHALVSLVLNRAEDIDIGEKLKSFREFSLPLSPQVYILII
jgi:ubiquitin carboxyl-terminal hydrolase L5